MHSELRKITENGKAFVREDLRRHSTFAIGGEADCFFFPADTASFTQAVCYCDSQQVNRHILGRGSNTLFSDDGYRGMVLCTLLLRSISIHGENVVCDAGVLNSALYAACVREELSGCEFLAGIPGTVGGAVVMNAGAYGGVTAEILDRVWILRKGEIVCLSGNELQFSYRRNHFLLPGDVILKCAFHLERGERGRIETYENYLSQKRKSTQPLDFPSCGSIFRRPEGTSAAELIDRCGLKGMTIGGAKVSEKHAGFIINFQEAKCADVLKLVDYIRKEVYNKYRVILQPEIEVAGTE